MALESLQDGVFSEKTDVVGSCLWTVFGFHLLCPSWQLLHAYLYIPSAMQKKSVWGKCKRCMPTSIATLCNARSLGQPLMLYCQAFIHDGFYDLVLHVKMWCMCKQINFFPPPISGHLVWPAGRYSVLAGCPTLEWTLSPLSSSWRQGSALGNLAMQHAQMRCEALDCLIVAPVTHVYRGYATLGPFQILHYAALLVWECW